MYQFSDEARQALESLALPLVFFQEADGKNIPILVSDGLCRLMGLDRALIMQEQTGSKFDRVHPEDVGRISESVRSFREKRSNYDVIYRTRYADNSYHYIHSVAIWWPMADGIELILVLYLDLQKWSNEVRQAADRYELFQRDRFYTDPLTALPNINYMHQFADERVNAIRLHGGTPVLLYTDTHSMQFYNNQYGFTRGNELLCLIAEKLKAAFPEALVMRGADDHFVIIDTFTDRGALSEKLLAANESIRKSAYGNTSGIQVGISLFEGEDSVPETVDHAKQALKLIRDDLNKVLQFYSHVDNEQYWNERYIIENFDRAMQEGWIKVYYQCIVRLETGKGAALEALARWIDPVRGIISPAVFIPVLRRYHLLYKLDLYMFEQVCREIPVRVEAGFQLLPVSINFTAQDFDYVDIPEELNKLYNRYDVSRYAEKGYFVVEITEEDIVSATDRFREQLQSLRRNGYRLWLDDFGSGYSSLSMFSRFDFHMIKFDMDLLRNLNDHNGANRRILKAMIGVAHELGIHTLVEGMETEEQRRFLLECSCELAQGYLVHRPEPLDAMLYRRKNGDKPRPCETPEERRAYIRKCYESGGI